MGHTGSALILGSEARCQSQHQLAKGSRSTEGGVARRTLASFYQLTTSFHNALDGVRSSGRFGMDHSPPNNSPGDLVVGDIQDWRRVNREL